MNSANSGYVILADPLVSILRIIANISR